MSTVLNNCRLVENMSTTSTNWTIFELLSTKASFIFLWTTVVFVICQATISVHSFHTSIPHHATTNKRKYIIWYQRQYVSIHEIPACWYYCHSWSEGCRLFCCYYTSGVSSFLIGYVIFHEWRRITFRYSKPFDTETILRQDELITIITHCEQM